MAVPLHVGRDRGSYTFVIAAVVAALLLIGVILYVQRQPSIPQPPPEVPEKAQH